MTGAFVAWSDKRRDSPGWMEDGSGCHIWIGAMNNEGYGVGCASMHVCAERMRAIGRRA